ncbi:MAG: primosomal protein N' [Atopobiaceae bacterium]|nr:primosomal protein N' [Atopobiaceae bacterium]MCH4180619.1 primosomal protein N' [Atopobiaceae bacterium]MCH4214235.1 primosomal protein N' [Atopobiaceae bacterium]MCH4277192.1 primosomal protein N' [Atopobiaceae bacterium]MCI1227125.1 primosomal protein N' [Atopobiaceae bacterium]
MAYAGVVIDIPTRALTGTFDYEIPTSLAQTAVVGTTVLVTFSHRAAVGYVVSVSPEPSPGVDPRKLLPVERVLAPSCFDEVSAGLAEWMSLEYACPLPVVLRLFLAPGQSMRVRRSSDNDPWELVCEKATPVDDRWVSLTDEGRAFEPRRNASRQREVLAALGAGPVRMAELSAIISGATTVVGALQKRGYAHIDHKRRVRGAEGTTLSSATAPRPERLTDGQVKALATIDGATSAGKGDVVLVDGVTGSGKTEVYLDAIERCLEAGRGAIVLVPEISLTAQTVGRFRSRFGGAVAILHSRLSVGERFDQWDLVRSGEARVVVGARSALFAPMRDVGLIVVDEEHEASYKQDSAPRYHARDVAAELARRRGAALVLGSATPSLESLERCQVGDWRGSSWTRVEMPERPGGALLPRVTVVDLKREFALGNRSIFSKPLRDGLDRVSEAHEKAVLMLNRRGFSSFLMCRECGCVPECPHCSTALTYHERSHSLVCHTCGSAWPIRAYPDPTTRCPNCGSRYLAQMGIGTQRVEDELSMILPPEVEVIRMDADTTSGKGAHQRLLEKFDAAECAVLVGTQMIAKGLDFPEVTLVGVINADTTLKLPDFRAGERTYDLLEQVAGRAGRGERPGEVVIQTYWPDHPAIASVARDDRSLFISADLADREEAYYPPFSRLANVLAWGRDSHIVEGYLDSLADVVRARAEAERGWRVVGPAECVKARAKDRFRRHFLVKAPPDADLGPILGGCVDGCPVPRGVSLAIDVDPYDLL